MMNHLREPEVMRNIGVKIVGELTDSIFSIFPFDFIH